MGTTAVAHVGFPKTATKLLQKRVFPAFADTVLIARNGRFGDAYRAVSHNLQFADEREYVPGLMRALVERAREEGEHVVISDEALCGAMYASGHTGERIAARLSDGLDGHGRILLTLRRQDDLLRSLYAFYVQKGGTSSRSTFLEGSAAGYPLDLSRFEFDRLIERYHALFGVDQVRVVAYEQLVDDPSAFVSGIAEFVGTRYDGAPLETSAENVSITGWSMLGLRAANRLARRSAFNARPLLGDRPSTARLRFHLQERQAKRGRAAAQPADTQLSALLARFKSSNQRAAQLSGLPLGELGYLGPHHAEEPTVVHT